MSYGAAILNTVRLLVLIFGPVPIVAGSVALSQWVGDAPRRLDADNHALVGENAHLFHVAEVEPRRTVEVDTPLNSNVELQMACRATAMTLMRRLGDECGVVVHGPFVIAGDFSRDQLDQWYRQTIQPATRAMAASYFDVRPDEPVRVLLFSDETAYNRFSKDLFGDEGVSIFGYYKPRQRTLVLNVSTGGGTLVHELTHALMAFDFEDAPDWFNEGLASLHEECRIQEDEGGIVGRVNWRLSVLQQALEEKRLRTLESLVVDDDFRRGDVGVNYAQARYFCLYMQRRGRLRTFYETFRANRESDRLGARSVIEVFPDDTWQTLEKDFRQWVMQLSRDA